MFHHSYIDHCTQEFAEDNEGVEGQKGIGTTFLLLSNPAHCSLSMVEFLLISPSIYSMDDIAGSVKESSPVK